MVNIFGIQHRSRVITEEQKKFVRRLVLRLIFLILGFLLDRCD
jgi:hypothetical protein